MKRVLIFFLVLICSLQAANAQSSAFTYQGKLTDAGTPATGTYDLTFRLFDMQAGGSQIGTEQMKDDVNASGGIFTVTLDFGSSPFLSNSGNYLEISVRPGASTGAFALLTPRQPITSSPYSVQTIRAESAGTADNANALGGTPAASFVQTTDTRLSDARPPTAGSPNYIQNGTGLQSSSNFNISGNGTSGGILSGNVVNAGTQFNIANTRVLRATDGTANTSLGVNAGFTGPSGPGNTFLGWSAGYFTTSGLANTFVGASVGSLTTSGQSNSFFGAETGNKNTDGSFNTFLGAQVGSSTAQGSGNTFVGWGSGTAASSNVTNNYNSTLGFQAGFSQNNLRWATAIGADSRAPLSDTIVIGKAAGTYGFKPELRPADTVKIPGFLQVNGVSTSLPSFRFHIRADGQDGIKIQHTGTGEYPQIRWTDSSDVFKASIGVGPTGSEGIHLFVNGSDRMIIENNGLIRTPGGIYIANPNTLVITSGNGACWGITVNNAGVLGAFSTPCP